METGVLMATELRAIPPRGRSRHGGAALTVLLALALGAGCTTRNPNYCDMDAGLTCTDQNKACAGNTCVARTDAGTDGSTDATTGHDGAQTTDVLAHDGPMDIAPPDVPAGDMARDLAPDRTADAPIEAPAVDMQPERPTCTQASCLSTADGGAPFCDPQAGTCTANCAVAPSACATMFDGGAPFCNTDGGGQCVGCLLNSDCITGNKLFCVANTCSTCTTAPANACANKSALTPVCSPAGNCVECNADANCMNAAKPFCVANACVTCVGAPATACMTKDSTRPVCNTGTMSCVPCNIDADCKTAAKPFCVANACVSCTGAPATACATKSAALPVCDATLMSCVECDVDADCKTTAKPTCTANHTCGACISDAQCAAKLGTATPNPGVCMSHQDGRCATNTETIYVGRFSTEACVNAPVTAAQGTVVQPLCNPNDAFGLLTATRRLVVVRGAVTGINWTFASLPAEVSIVGHPNAASAPGLIAGLADPGVQITTGRIYLRGLQVKQSTTGITIDSGSIVRMDSVLVQGNMNGGVRIRASGFDIENSILAANGGGLDPIAGVFGGLFLDNTTAPPTGAPQHFAFDTVVQNTVGIVARTPLIVWASLLGGNGGGDTIGTMASIPAQFSKVSDPAAMYDPTTFRIASGSSCRDLFTGTALTNAMNGMGDVAPLPKFDIDGQTRPQGANYDCGADEFAATP